MTNGSVSPARSSPSCVMRAIVNQAGVRLVVRPAHGVRHIRLVGFVEGCNGSDDCAGGDYREGCAVIPLQGFDRPRSRRMFCCLCHGISFPSWLVGDEKGDALAHAPRVSQYSLGRKMVSFWK